jgi:LysM repeat protein
MFRQNRIIVLLRPCVALLCVGGFAVAQETAAPAPTPPATAEVNALRSAIEKQAQQIEVLTKEIAELKSLIKKGQTVRLINQRPPTPGEAEPTPEKPEPAPAPAAAQTPAAAGSPPQAEPAPAADGSKHTVAKGETLTSIAKRYNIPLAELQKTNQIQDDRKLQIGQVLKIPSTAKTPEPPNQTKENP